jgi:hypothetical protein
VGLPPELHIQLELFSEEESCPQSDSDDGNRQVEGNDRPSTRSGRENHRPGRQAGA